MISKFNFYFVREYSDNFGKSVESLQTEPKQNNSGTPLCQLVEEIKAFVMLVLQSMIHYYGGVISDIIEKKPGEMYDLILEEVFTDSLQDCLLKAFYQVNSELDLGYRKNVELYSKLFCCDLGIEPKFQLDIPNGKDASVGYAKAITKLRELEYNYSPLKKLVIIIETTRLICECVDDYYIDDSSMNKENLVIDADQILSIFLYIVIKAKIINLKGHLNLIYDFGRKIVQNGQMGYYVTTLEACILQIESMGSELLTKLKEYAKP